MATELDMINRDPQNMNNHIQVMFDDVLAEPNGAHSADCVWQNSYKCFTGGSSCCYSVLTYLCGLPVALGWGCFFACLSFYEIWFMTPTVRAVNIALYSTRKLYSIMLNACLAPMMEATGMIFSRIHVTNATGQPNAPLGSMTPGGNVKNFK